MIFNYKTQHSGMQTFVIIWFGQLVSLLGTAMTRFALMIWAYQKTGDATTLALLGFFGFVPYILLSPPAGVWVDRWDRRRVMLFADLGAGLMTAILLTLYMTGGLHIWHLYLLEAAAGAFEAFQLPAYAAATTMLVPREQIARVSGMRSLAYDAGRVFAPFFAGALLPFIDIHGVMLIDVATFLVAMTTLLMVRVPRPAVSKDGQAARGNMGREMRFGFHYILERPGLLGLVFIFFGMNLFAALTYFSILPAMILARSGGDELALASVQSVLGIAGVVGGLVVGIRGLPRRRIHAVLLGGTLSFMFGDFLFAVGQNVVVWCIAAFMSAFFIPFIISGDRAIWQTKVAPDVQGRVFSAQAVIRQTAMPIGYLLAGPLADRLFEPALAANGSLAGVFGGLVGTGPGAGMGLMFVCTWMFGTTVCVLGYLFRAVRRVEADLPDYEIETAPTMIAEAVI